MIFFCFVARPLFNSFIFTFSFMVSSITLVFLLNIQSLQHSFTNILFLDCSTVDTFTLGYFFPIWLAFGLTSNLCFKLLWMLDLFVFALGSPILTIINVMGTGGFDYISYLWDQDTFSFGVLVLGVFNHFDCVGFGGFTLFLYILVL